MPRSKSTSRTEGDQFTSTQGTGVEDLQNGPIPQSQRPRDLGTRQDGRHLGCRQRRLGELAVRSWRFQVGCGIDAEHTTSVQPCEELLDRDQPLGLGGERKRLSVDLTVIKELLLVGLQQFEGHFVHGSHTVAVEEGHQVRQVPGPVGNGRPGVVVDSQPRQIVGHVGLDGFHGTSPHRRPTR